VLLLQGKAFAEDSAEAHAVPHAGDYHFRSNAGAEKHLNDPAAIAALQAAVQVRCFRTRTIHYWPPMPALPPLEAVARSYCSLQPVAWCFEGNGVCRQLFAMLSGGTTQLALLQVHANTRSCVLLFHLSQ
jgi:hypothetical protein